jgi:hypothetical protein
MQITRPVVAAVDAGNDHRLGHESWLAAESAGQLKLALGSRNLVCQVEASHVNV